MRNGHCMKSFRIRSFSGTYFPLFGQNTDQKNSEYGDLYAVGIFIKINPLGMSYHRIIQAMLFFQHIVRFLWQSNKYVPKLTFWGGVFYSSSLTAKKNLNSFHFRRDLWLENLSDFCCLAMHKRGPNTTFYVIFFHIRN